MVLFPILSLSLAALPPICLWLRRIWWPEAQVEDIEETLVKFVV
jgi:hypothetical protein